MSDDELPLVSALLRLNPSTAPTNSATKLRRSPRKHTAIDTRLEGRNTLDTIPELHASSRQQRSPVKKPVSQKATKQSSRDSEPNLKLKNIPQISFAGSNASKSSKSKSLRLIPESWEVMEEWPENKVNASKAFTKPKSRKQIPQYDSDSDKENTISRVNANDDQSMSKMSRITRIARQQDRSTIQPSRSIIPRQNKANPYILKEAHCEDLNESSGTDGEDTDTDLSGFVVDDDATLSFHGSAIEISSDESEQDSRRRKHIRKEELQVNTRRRLVRGRQKSSFDSDPENETTGLSSALNNMGLGQNVLEKEKNSNRRKTIEVIDLTSSPAPEGKQPLSNESRENEETGSQESLQSDFDPLSLSMANLILQPTKKSHLKLLPTKIGSAPADASIDISQASVRPVTPPATPPRDSKRPQSPTKLKSPSKLFSPSKRALERPNSTARQSLDAFWDHNVINEWTDTFSPKKVVLGSPQRGNFLNSLSIHEDNDSISDLECSKHNDGGLDDSSDLLPSPCESPSKGKSASPSKLSVIRTNTIKRKEAKAAKQKFDSKKEELALDILRALDSNITASKISALSASTGGIKVVWSKTLRSTAGRANWKRSVTKASGSPIKSNESDTISASIPGVLVQHYASIELADKVIDREERLIDTVAHEFCHLANFMISNIRDQPHGSSFQQWGKKVTSFLRSSAARHVEGYRPSWRNCEVTTKHSYVVEYKYLFVCNGRPKEKRTLAEKFLDLDDEEGCGAEYGRHSKSIDTDKQRCGRCKGILVQVRPTPRAAPSSPRKLSPRKKLVGPVTDVGDLEKMIASVDLGD